MYKAEKELISLLREALQDDAVGGFFIGKPVKLSSEYAVGVLYERDVLSLQVGSFELVSLLPFVKGVLHIAFDVLYTVVGKA